MAYEAIPLRDTAERAEVISTLMREICGLETAFSDFQSGCEDACYEETPIPEMCERCSARMQVVALALQKGLTWEVWKDDEDEDAELVGVIRFSSIRPGEEATGHYLFFDHDLRGKTQVLLDVIEWAFEDHEGWDALKRLTVEIPDYAFALARHASKRLGFGGPFEWELGGKRVNVEGVKQDAVQWRGTSRDLLILGLRRRTIKDAAEPDAA